MWPLPVAGELSRSPHCLHRRRLLLKSYSFSPRPEINAWVEMLTQVVDEHVVPNQLGSECIDALPLAHVE